MIAKLFVATLLCVLTAVGFAVSALGWAALAAYVLVVVGLVSLAVRRERARSAGRTCTCCTSTVFDPVEVR
jgi:hypothetical protein